MWVVARGFDMWVNAIEYMIVYPSVFTWFSDVIDSGAITIGNSRDGIAVAYRFPANGFEPLVVQMLTFAWMCNTCDPPNQDLAVVVTGYPSSGKVRAVRWPDLATSDAVGMTSTVCSLSPVAETTWGHVKAMFRD
jgi:hypothetical protein